MALTPGAVSSSAVSSTSATVTVGVATGGTGPYTYQWYKSTASGFTPGPGNIIPAATGLSYTDTSLSPTTVYYYVNVVTDTGAGNATAASAQLTVTTLALVINPNQFSMAPVQGQLDLRFNAQTLSGQIDVSSAGGLIAGQSVKMVNSFGGVPKFVECAADSDDVYGFINYDIKTQVYNAGFRVEVSAMRNNVMYMSASAAIARNAALAVVISGVKVVTAATGQRIIGRAYDEATVPGQLIRVTIDLPGAISP